MPMFKKMSTRHVIVIVFLVAVALRICYGVGVYRHVLTTSGPSFIALWDFDAIEHVLIAKALMEGKGYVVDSNADLTGKHPRIIGGPALFKAPLYQFLLAGIFSISGFSFVLFFPLQALLGGGLSVLVAKIAMGAFQDHQTGLYAGLAAAAHPVLINTAAQPYNENFFFFLFFLSVCVFFWWLASPSWKRAILFGVTAGLATLTRESVVLPFAIMTVLGVLNSRHEARTLALGSALAMIGGFLMAVAPWTLHNYRQFGIVLPVSSISGTSLGIGNNECVAVGSLTTPFDGDVACPAVDAQREALLKGMPREPEAVWNDHAYASLGREFLMQNPGEYLELSFRRAWTTFLPYHPRQALGGSKALIVVLYFILVIVMGLASMLWGALKGLTREAKVLMWVALASYVPLVAIYVSADLRYRVGIDLVLACFAGWGYTLLARRFMRGLRSTVAGASPKVRV